MRLIPIVLALSLSLVTPPLLAFEPPSLGAESHSNWKTDDVILLKDQMHRMKTSFSDLNDYLDGKPPAYKDILVTLDRMEGIAKMIQKVNGNPSFEPNFKRLQSIIKDFQSEAKAQNRSGMENGMSDLIETCFGCHLTHSAPRPAKTVPDKKP